MLESDRCILRPWMVSDARSLFLLNADNRVMRYTGDVPFRSVGETVLFIESYQKVYTDPGIGRMAISRKEDGQNLGWCGFKKHKNGVIDLGFRLFCAEWGKGYASETAQACINAARKTYGFKAIIARAHPDNERSHALIRRLGFKTESNPKMIDKENFISYVLHL